MWAAAEEEMDAGAKAERRKLLTEEHRRIATALELRWRNEAAAAPGAGDAGVDSAAPGAYEADYDESGCEASGGAEASGGGEESDEAGGKAGSQKESGGRGAASAEARGEAGSGVETAGEGDEASTSTLYYVLLCVHVCLVRSALARANNGRILSKSSKRVI